MVSVHRIVKTTANDTIIVCFGNIFSFIDNTIGDKNNFNSGVDSWAGGKYILIRNQSTFGWGHAGSSVSGNIPYEKSFIIKTGRMGIGVTEVNAAAKLHVKGDVKIENLSFNHKTLPAIPIDDAEELYYDETTLEVFHGNDLSELFETNEEVEIGDLLVIDKSQDMKLKKCASAYDKGIIGIVSGAPAILFEESKLQIAPEPFVFKKGAKPPVTLAGRVPCKVSLENGSIKQGDLLTSSNVPGHAMKATDMNKAFNAVIGKAMQSFDGGTNGEKTGMIMVLVTRQ